VIGVDRRGKQLVIDGIPRLSAPIPDALQAPSDNALRIVTVNLHNYFNGDGRGAGFPAPRGARNPKELARQNRWISAAVHRMRAHLLAVQEIENDGFGKLSASQSLSDELSESGQSWTAINPGTGRIGDDAIAVGLIYQPGRLAPAADAEVLSGPAFDGLSRQPLAQHFRDILTGETFLIIVNHLKSKGGCPEGKTGDRSNSDLNDGQGCWNGARVAAARAVAAWSLDLADRYNEPRILITGDMNAYRQEDPIQSFRNAGFTEIIEEKNEPPYFSFSYFGRYGTLDYAFASEELLKEVNAAQIWHVNAPWPSGMALPETWLRFSDHDPVIVDLLFSQSATSD
jgi:predicted extracellular nuclease